MVDDPCSFYCRGLEGTDVVYQEGGWTRQTTVRELPSSTELAGVNMRLDSGAIRELHWHKEAEWAYGQLTSPALTC